jgi:U1 small nuclear ribonucleoprotein
VTWHYSDVVAISSGAAAVDQKFTPSRPPLEYAKPFDKCKYRPLEGIKDNVRDYFSLFENGPPPEKVKEETPQEKKFRDWKEKIIQNRKKIREEIKKWNPKNYPNITTDPYKTLFVCRLSSKTTAKHLKRTFEEYGPISKLFIIHDTKSDKSRNYAFIEYEDINDFKSYS